jgi:hypothetical protein
LRSGCESCGRDLDKIHKTERVHGH